MNYDLDKGEISIINVVRLIILVREGNKPALNPEDSL